MEKYLRHYAEPETAALDALDTGGVDEEPWANVLVIPACNETAELLRPPPECNGRSLMILVINESEAASHAVSTHNRALAASVQARFQQQWQSAPEYGLTLWRDPYVLRDVLLVDCFSEGRRLPVKGGVGHARKIGADLAAGLINRNCIQSHWIHCSDADVQLPKTYFTCSRAEECADPKYSALVYPFRHRGHQESAEQRNVLLATELYELSLRYYVAGMKFARSPYAFHTIGSTMAVNAIHYAKVRGFPKREAAEDFYLLNKLAKVGSIKELTQSSDCEPIQIEARRSDRVPFGTGAAVNVISALDDPVKAFRFYHPGVFQLLQQWLQSWPAIWQSRSSALGPNISPSGEGDQWQPLLICLKNLKAEQALDHAFQQSKDLDQFGRQMHTWFDAFRTLKLIHDLRDHYLPSINYAELGTNQEFGELLTLDPELLAFHEQLRSKLTAGTQ